MLRGNDDDDDERQRKSKGKGKGNEIRKKKIVNHKGIKRGLRLRK